MSLDWWIFLALCLWALMSVLGAARRLSRGLAAGVVLSALVLLAVASAWSLRSTRSANAEDLFAQTLPREGRPGGYVTSDQCRSCHPSQYDSWHRTYHRTMTQWAGPGSVVGNFSGVTLPWQGKACELERDGDQFRARLPLEVARPGATRGASTQDTVEERFGMLTGSHHMQVYWVPSRLGNLQAIFPHTYLIADQRWVPFVDTFLRDPNLPPANPSWNRTCINCHSVGGQPRANLQAGVTDTQVGELGIACEACHGPAEAHIVANRNPWRRYRLHLSGQAETTIVNPNRQNSRRASQICGQCHSIRWLPNAADQNENGARYRPGDDLDQSVTVVRPAKLEEQPQLREPLRRDPRFLPDRYWNDGIVRVSGREYNGMIESGCYQRGQLSCLSCHWMHESNPVNQLAPRMDSNAACLQCHTRLANSIQAHTHHGPESAGSQCYNCHMPYTTYGLLKAIRSHYIDSPNVRTSLATGRPNACNLCHLDQTSQWTANYLNQWYNQPALDLQGPDRDVSAAVLLALRGEAGQRALIAWSMGWNPAQEASGSRWLVPYLAQLLEDPYSAVRYIAQRSLKRIPEFSSTAYDFVGSAEQRTSAARQVLERWRRSYPAGTVKAGSQILLAPGGALQLDQFQRLLLSRDDRSMDLQE
jgi:predicted CXXCH cytochrome family protein